jgi:hypothetical protein
VRASDAGGGGMHDTRECASGRSSSCRSAARSKSAARIQANTRPFPTGAQPWTALTMNREMAILALLVDGRVGLRPGTSSWN